jgi:hypothetical protein
MTVSFVFPNTADIRQRGGLEDRSRLAKAAGCRFIEVPADLIKNKTEAATTGQEFSTFLTKESIKKLYAPTEDRREILPYIFHTDPALNPMVRLRWNDPAWTEEYVGMILEISDYLGTPPAKIEIHPGDRENTFMDIVRGVKAFQSGFHDSYGKSPEILLENRTGQFISRGSAIAGLREYTTKHYPELADTFGIVLDVQQLSTVTRANFLSSFNEVPSEFLKGFHIHRLHRPPMLDDGIPWLEVFGRITSIEHDVIINPEVLHNNLVAGVIGFCNELLKRTEAGAAALV